MGRPEKSITSKKQVHMIACAEHYATENEINHWQIDVISIEEKPGIEPTITYFYNAIYPNTFLYNRKYTLDMTPSKKPSPSFSQHDLLNACAQPGCPVCRVGANSVKRYLKSIFNEYVNDSNMRANLLRSLGFCLEHTQLLLNTRIADALGASIIYENIVKKILRELPHQPKVNDFKRASDRTGNCMACEQEDALLDRSLNELRKTLGEEKMRNALQESDGLCFPHLTQVLERIKNTDDADYLLALTKTKLETRQAEMVELIRKNDHRFQSEGISEDQALAWKKAMCMITGVSISPLGDKHG